MNRFLLLFSFMFTMLFSFPAAAQLKNTSMQKAKVTRKTELNANGDSSIVYYGVASYYADKFTGRQTATGDSYSHKGYTAACNVLPLGTWIRVTNLKNDRAIILRVNDRLHAKNNRLVDLTRSAASKLGYIKSGLARVKVEVLGKKKPKD
jgi:rare lipoprotein A